VVSLVLAQPIEIMLELLLHECFLDDDCEDVGDDSNSYEKITVQVDDSGTFVNLKEVEICIIDHITIHQGDKRKAAVGQVLESLTLPE